MQPTHKPQAKGLVLGMTTNIRLPQQTAQRAGGKAGVAQHFMCTLTGLLLDSVSAYSCPNNSIMSWATHSPLGDLNHGR